jgi:predicted GNAT family N-acyltransferase
MLQKVGPPEKSGGPSLKDENDKAKDLDELNRTAGMKDDLKYRFMEPGEEQKVCVLVAKVFNEFVAPEYGQDGIDEFFKFADAEAMAGRASSEQVVMIAEIGAEIVGIIEIIRNNHISLLFVSRRGEGIAKRLLTMAIEECGKRQPGLKEVTVNSSPYAKPIYRAMGFQTTGPLQKKNGIIFVPMTCRLGQCKFHLSKEEKNEIQSD